MHLFICKQTHSKCVSSSGTSCQFTGHFQWRGLLIISLLHHERNPAAPLRDPNGDVFGFPPPSPKSQFTHSGNAIQTRATSNCPCPHLSYLYTHSPQNHGPKPRPHPTTLLCAWVVAQPGYCLAQLPSTYFMHKQTTQWR